MDSKSYTAIVQRVYLDGKHGPYAVALSTEIGNITFSLKPPVWTEKYFPEGGSVIVLSEIVKKRAGWRANCGRFLEPSDEQPSNQKQSQQRKGATR